MNITTNILNCPICDNPLEINIYKNKYCRITEFHHLRLYFEKEKISSINLFDRKSKITAYWNFDYNTVQIHENTNELDGPPGPPGHVGPLGPMGDLGPVGYNALKNNTTGYYNYAIGYSSIYIKPKFPFFEPNFSDYNKLINKLKTCLIFT
jgi:hypothetical protein